MTVLAVFGPTGVGKTGVAIELAKLLRERGEDPVAINCDALQVYEGLDVLTGAATAAQREVLPHELLGFVPVTEDFSIQRVHADGPLGRGRGAGSGAGRRSWSAAPASTCGRRWPTSRCARCRPSPKNRSCGRGRRAIRPGSSASTWIGRQLYERIDARVDAIVAGGGEEEARRADALGAGRTARKALGLNELLAGDLETMKRRSRNYARRQLTWMRKIPDLTPIDRTDMTDQERRHVDGPKPDI